MMKLDSIDSFLLKYLFIILFAAASSMVFAVEDNEFFLDVYGEKTYIDAALGEPVPKQMVKGASGRDQLLSEAPAIATVITAEDIQENNWDNLEEALESVAGLHVSRRVSNSPLYVFRGIHSEYNPGVLVLLNGVPLTHDYPGSRGFIHTTLFLNAVERIEVIRGPGSVVYGANAFSGSINIVLKSYHTVEEKVGVQIGSFNTKTLWVQNRIDWNGLKVTTHFDIHSSDGYKGVIEEDAQSINDRSLGSSASLAPGEMNNQGDMIHGYLNINYKNSIFNFAYQKYDNFGTGAGFGFSLDPWGEFISDRYILDYSYSFINESWDQKIKVAFTHFDEDITLFLSPPNSLILLDDEVVLFTLGSIGAPKYKERKLHLEYESFFRGIENHLLGIGIGGSFGEMFDIKEFKTFDQQGYPFDTLVDATGNADLIYMEPQSRRNWFLFLQDEWQWDPDWQLTLGFRFDEYSDFGSTLNPRLALMHDFSYRLTGKFLYGKAFRVPSYAELYVKNNPLNIGNKNLKPEIINTWELGVDYLIKHDFLWKNSIFYYQAEDLIKTIPGDSPSTRRTYINQGKQTGYGFETEVDYKPHPKVTLTGNYSFQRSIDEDADEEAGNAPNHQVFFGVHYYPQPQWLLHADMHYVGKQKREYGDARPDMAAQTYANFHVRYQPDDKSYRAGLKIENVFNEDVREPSLAPGLIPNDIPQPGRAIYGYVEVLYD